MDWKIGVTNRFARLPVLALAVCLFPAVLVEAMTIEAPSLSLSAVQAAVERASNGDVVLVPAGREAWSKPLIVSKGIEVKGAGIGKTILTNPNTGWLKPLIQVDASPGRPFRIDGFTFEGAGATPSDHADCIIICGNVDGFRIDHNVFENGGAHSVWIYGEAYGVIDHDRFINPSEEVVSIFDGRTGDASWDTPLGLGGPNAVYVENNTFVFQKKGDHAITGVNGTRYVFRYNTVTTAAKLNSSIVDMHGNYFDTRGGRSFEIYNNTFNSGGSYQGFYLRGGSGVIFDNTFTGSFYHPIIFTQYRAFERSTVKGRPADSSCGYVNCSYPSPDQIHDVYVWNNTYDGRPVVPYVDERGIVRQMIQLGRDYFLRPMPGYEPYAYPNPIIHTLFRAG